MCVFVSVCVCVSPIVWLGECVPSRVRSSGTRWGPASAHQLTARASLRPSNTLAHEPANNGLKLMHAPHHQIWYSPNGRHGNSSEKERKEEEAAEEEEKEGAGGGV